jgi:hypothetical protein
VTRAWKNFPTSEDPFAYWNSCVSIHFSLPIHVHPHDSSHTFQPIRDSSDTEDTGDRYAFYASADLPLLPSLIYVFLMQTLAETEK